MRRVSRSTAVRLLAAAAGTAALAMFLLLVNPWSVSVLGQTNGAATQTAGVAPGQTIVVAGATIANESAAPVEVVVLEPPPPGVTIVVTGTVNTPTRVIIAGTSATIESNPPGQFVEAVVVNFAGVETACPRDAVGAAVCPLEAGATVRVLGVLPQGTVIQAVAASAPDRAAQPAAARSAPGPAAQAEALPRTDAAQNSAGVSGADLAGYGLLALAAAFGSAGMVLAVRRTRR